MGRDSIIFRRDWYEVAKDISDEAMRLRYLMAILDYAFDGVEPEDGQTALMTMMARLQIDRQRRAKQDISEKRRKAAATRYRMQLHANAANAANASKCMQLQANAACASESMQMYAIASKPLPPLESNAIACKCTSVEKDDEEKERTKEKEVEEKETLNKEKKDTPNGVKEKKAQQAAQGGVKAEEEDSSSSLNAKNQEEKGCAEKEEVPLVEVEVVTSRPKAQPPRFTPPTVAEVAAYCLKRNNGIDAEQFCAYYAQSGWKIKGGNQMKDWHAAVITWEKYRRNNNGNNTRTYDDDKGIRDAEFVRYWAGRVGDKPVQQ